MASAEPALRVVAASQEDLECAELAAAVSAADAVLARLADALAPVRVELQATALLDANNAEAPTLQVRLIFSRSDDRNAGLAPVLLCANCELPSAAAASPAVHAKVARLAPHVPDDVRAALAPVVADALTVEAAAAAAAGDAATAAFSAALAGWVATKRAREQADADPEEAAVAALAAAAAGDDVAALTAAWDALPGLGASAPLPGRWPPTSVADAVVRRGHRGMITAVLDRAARRGEPPPVAACGRHARGAELLAWLEGRVARLPPDALAAPYSRQQEVYELPLSVDAPELAWRVDRGADLAAHGHPHLFGLVATSALPGGGGGPSGGGSGGREERARARAAAAASLRALYEGGIPVAGRADATLLSPWSRGGEAVHDGAVDPVDAAAAAPGADDDTPPGALCARADAALNYAVQLGHLPLVRWLVEAGGANPRYGGDAPLRAAAACLRPSHSDDDDGGDDGPEAVFAYLHDECGCDLAAAGGALLPAAFGASQSWRLVRRLVGLGAPLTPGVATALLGAYLLHGECDNDAGAHGLAGDWLVDAGGADVADAVEAAVARGGGAFELADGGCHAPGAWVAAVVAPTQTPAALTGLGWVGPW